MYKIQCKNILQRPIHTDAELYLILCKVVFIILSPSPIEASQTGLMRQFELFAIITQPIALMSVAACLASGRLCLSISVEDTSSVMWNIRCKSN